MFIVWCHTFVRLFMRTNSKFCCSVKVLSYLYSWPPRPWWRRGWRRWAGTRTRRRPRPPSASPARCSPHRRARDHCRLRIWWSPCHWESEIWTRGWHSSNKSRQHHITSSLTTTRWPSRSLRPGWIMVSPSSASSTTFSELLINFFPDIFTVTRFDVWCHLMFYVCCFRKNSTEHPHMVYTKRNRFEDHDDRADRRDGRH